MAETHFLTNCPRCGYIAEAWTEDGVTVKIHCKMCGYEGTQPHPDLKERPWKVG
jgi:Zn ribbon nucleic-acid-binding protein